MPPAPTASLGQRLALRFGIAYFGLYAIATPMASFLLVLPDGRSVGEHGWYRLVMWVGTHVFGLAGINANKGSGDRMFDWVQMAIFLVMAAVVAVAWVAVERRRLDDARLRAWWFAGLRCGLGGVLLPFPCIKAIDLLLTALGVR